MRGGWSVLVAVVLASSCGGSGDESSSEPEIDSSESSSDAATPVDDVVDDDDSAAVQAEGPGSVVLDGVVYSFEPECSETGRTVKGSGLITVNGETALVRIRRVGEDPANTSVRVTVGVDSEAAENDADLSEVDIFEINKDKQIIESSDTVLRGSAEFVGVVQRGNGPDFFAGSWSLDCG